MRLMAIDPGSTESAYVVIDTETYAPLIFEKLPNEMLLGQLTLHQPRYHRVVIEMIASYGMPVGAEVFETCVMIGRYQQSAIYTNSLVDLAYRKNIKLHLCGTSKAKDANITQALVDRFAHGQGNHGKGTKAAPGFFHGFFKDVWAAYAVAVYYVDTALVNGR